MSLLVDQTRTYMLASSVPSLKNQELCNFLAEMDRNEILKLEGENARFIQEDVRLKAEDEKLESAYSWKNILRDSSGFGLTVGLTSAVPVLISEKINCKSIEQGLKRVAVVSACTGVCTTVVELIWYGRTKYVIFSNSDSLKVGYAMEIISDRSSRLQEKIDGIAQRLGQQQGQDAIQLSAAKDYFDQKRKELSPEQKA